jgi:hypothetical protein
MSLDNFIPEIWSAELLRAYERALVYGQPGVVNRDYEGDISAAGDTVRINSIGDPTIGSYTKNTNMAAVETLTDAQATLLIDQQKYFNFQVDDIDAAQQKPKVMAAAMERAGFGLRSEVDTFIAALYTDAAGAIGTTGSPKTVTSPVTASNELAYTYLVDLGVILDEADVPSDGRFAIVPSWFHGLLLKDDRFVASGVQSAASALANGFVGEAAGFRIMKSNNVPNTTATKYRIIAGHPSAWSFAAQITSVEAYRPELRFANAVKGLLVFGAKVVKPAGLAVLVANKA